MATIKAPFNFVPLSEKVYFPDWADKISQDIPFEDGVSGTIELKITAETPIFVRNGHTREDADVDAKNDNYKSFSKAPDGKYFIPATSIKGAIRNVLEIISAGKMGFIGNQSFGIRDLSTNADGNFYREKIKPENIHCGWLSMSNDKYILNDCGLPWRISAEEIDRKLGIGLDDFVRNGNFKKDENRTAQAKYSLSEGTSLVNTFSADNELRKALKVGNRLFVRFDKEGESGTIVFTGQPGERKKGNRTNKKGEKKWEGKYFEFVFPFKTENKNIEIPETTYKEFVSIHKESPDYINLWKNKIQEGEKIPVFFMASPNKTIEAIGLSYMFKYPAFNSIFTAIRKDDLNHDKMDLTEAILGQTSNTNSTKGRVQFGHAFCLTTNPIVLKERSLILSSPNPSYYPLYLGNGQTWNSETIHIAGRKRYPTRNNIYQSTQGTDEMQSHIIPLDKNTLFKGTIRFHNLKPIELGAIISAITFDGNQNCRHNIGSGKPYGYGKVHIEIESLKTTETTNSREEFINKFHEEVNDYQNQDAIRELQMMAIGIPNEKDSDFSYMHMDTNRNTNEFLKGKEEYSNGNQLGLFSQILSGEVPRAHFIGNVTANKQHENIEAVLLKQQERRNTYNKMMTDAKEAFFSKNLDLAKECLASAKEFCVSFVEINEWLCKVEETETVIKQKETEAAQQAAEAETKARLQAKVEGGLTTMLDEKYEFGPNVGKYKVADFKVCKNKVLSWLKAANLTMLPTEQMDSLKTTLLRLKDNAVKKEMNQWTDFKNDRWQTTIKWVGEDIAKQWFDEICK
ncbi:MAG: TIGR03986 family CRISPR-associated RAMP protein [Prevotellaceae bacterium]|nr:TIGR03986 family CRISPR-associated RAMP protein [Prevotellaceae bacterium]